MKTEFSVYKSHHKYSGETQGNNNRMNYNYTSTDQLSNLQE